MTRPRRTALAAALAAGALAAVTSTGSAAPVALTACAPQPDLLCGTLAVPEDRAAPGGATLDLRVRVVPGPSRPRGTVVFLPGGPGQASLSADASLERFLARLAPDHRIVVFDPRGTGATALRCPALDAAGARVPVGGEGPAAAEVTACAELIGPRRRLYTTAETVADLEDLRAGLGVTRWTLMGVSYGTAVATAYARAHPDATDAMILDSPVAPEGYAVPDTVSLAAARRVLAGLCAGARCRGVTGDLPGDIARLQARLATREVRGVRVDLRGVARPAAIGGPSRPFSVYDLLRAGDLTPSLRTAIPAAVRAALGGDATPLLRLSGTGDDGPGPEVLSAPLLLATTCQESRLPWTTEPDAASRDAALDAAIAASPPAAFAPFGPAAGRRGLASLCAGWPDAPRAILPSGPLPDVPTLILSGTADIRTPLEGARELAARLPRARLVRAPRAGHSVVTSHPGCAGAAVRAFLDGLRVPTCDPLEAGTIAAVPPRSARTLRPVGAPGRAGRSVRALVLTQQDLRVGLSTARPGPRGTVVVIGLRGGRAILDFRRDRVTFARYEVVAGIRVTGVFDGRTTVGRVRFSGPYAARGGLTFIEEGDRISVLGRLDGRRVLARNIPAG